MSNVQKQSMQSWQIICFYSVYYGCHLTESVRTLTCGFTARPWERLQCPQALFQKLQAVSDRKRSIINIKDGPNTLFAGIGPMPLDP